MTGIIAAFALHTVLAASPYKVDYLGDGSLTLSSLGIAALANMTRSELVGGISCKRVVTLGGGERCDPAELNALDRSVVGNDSQTWSTLSDIGANSSYVLPLVFDAIDVFALSHEGVGDFTADAVVMAESVGLATLATTALKFAVRRPRPTQYRDGAYVGTVEHQLSFPSGHTSSTAAAMGAYASTFFLRHPNSPWRFAVAAGAVALTALTGYARIGGGWHFPTDVLAGALLGATAGIVVPKMHERGVAVSSVAPLAGAGTGTALGASMSFAF